MQPSSRARLVLPFLIIVVGVGWLLTVQGVVPGINWIWTLGLGVIGILAFVLSGFDKFSAAVGPFFLIASLFSILRQTGRLSVDVEVPSLVITIGVVLLIAQHPAIPNPAWMISATPAPENPSRTKK